MMLMFASENIEYSMIIFIIIANAIIVIIAIKCLIIFILVGFSMNGPFVVVWVPMFST